MICSQSIAETGSGVAVVGVGISGRVGIEASSSKDVFRLSRVPLLLYRALSIVYSGEVGE